MPQNTSDKTNTETTALEEMMADADMTPALVALQEEAAAKLNRIIDALASSMMIERKLSRKKSVPIASPTLEDTARLSRQHDLAAKACRDLAWDMIIAALKNSNNPDWNPADPATNRPSEKDPLLMLLQMNAQ